MADAIKKLCGLLRSAHAEQQCAAAVVLGELKPNDPGVVRALGEVVSNGENRLLKGYALDALGKIGSRRALPYVLPLLGSDSDLGEKAVRVVAALGSGVAADLGALLRRAGPTERRAIHVALARVRGPLGLRLLVHALAEPEPGVLEDTLHAIRFEMKAAAPKERRALIAHVTRFLKGKAARESVAARVAAIKVLGSLDDASVQPLLLRHSDPAEPAVLRSAALHGLRSTPRPKGDNAALATKLFGFLGDKDFSGIVSPALDVLYPLRLKAAALPALEALADSPKQEVKRFALQKLREFDSQRATAVLMRFLEDQDPSVRDLAASSLMNIKTARVALLDRLLREHDSERAWTFARILKPHAALFGREQVQRLAEAVVRLLDQDSRLHEPVLFLARAASADATRAALLRRGLRKKRSRRFDEAARTFRLLERQDLFDAEVRFELAVALAKVQPPRDNAADRAAHPAVALAGGLIDDAFPLFERLRRETTFAPLDLYHLGAHFVRDGEPRRSVGAELLRLVLRKSPKSDTATAARNRLHEVGLK